MNQNINVDISITNIGAFNRRIVGCAGSVPIMMCKLWIPLLSNISIALECSTCSMNITMLTVVLTIIIIAYICLCIIVYL